ncbi:type II secretion system F family protein [Candidatus Pacebacteria bacterium]|nr:type II secretion system F family protein [Candidatus Paceibacterota bacterium]
MAKFTYEGTTKSGEAVTRTVDAKDRFEVYDIARKDGNAVKNITAASKLSVSKFFNVEKIEYFISRVKQDDLVMTTRNLGSMITAGLALTRALSVIERQTSNPKLKGIMKQIQADINAGEPFNAALAKFPKVFDDLYVAMVRAGEESGQLSETLQVLGLQMERSSSLKKKIKGAMIYPAIVITILVIIGILMMIYVMPSITDTFVKLDIDLPATTQFLINTSNFINNNFFLFIGMLIGSVVGVIYFFRTKIGKKIFSWLVVRLPVIGKLAKEANAARTARTLSSLLSSGVDIVRAINITEDVVQNVYYKKVLAEAAEKVEKGTALSEPFIANTKLYPVLVGEMILVGEETGQISQMLKQLAEFYETEVEQKTKDLSTIIEPILMVVIGGTVGFFALAVITPIYGISDAI